jgi:hypothetical protein
MPTTSNKHVPNILTGHGTQNPTSSIMPPIGKLEEFKFTEGSSISEKY